MGGIRALSLIKIPGASGGGGDTLWGFNSNSLYPLSNKPVSLGLIQNGTYPLNLQAYDFSGQSGIFENVQTPNYGHVYSDGTTGGRFTRAYATFNGVNANERPNVVGTMWGYNTSPGGGPTIVGEAGFGFRTETYYQIAGGNDFFEFHLPEVYTTSGQWWRVWSMYIDRHSGLGFTQSKMGSFAFYTGATADQPYILMQGNNASGGTLSGDGNVQINSWNTPHGAATLYLNTVNDGTSTIIQEGGILQISTVLTGSGGSGPGNIALNGGPVNTSVGRWTFSDTSGTGWGMSLFNNYGLRVGSADQSNIMQIISCPLLSNGFVGFGQDPGAVQNGVGRGLYFDGSANVYAHHLVPFNYAGGSITPNVTSTNAGVTVNSQAGQDMCITVTFTTTAPVSGDFLDIAYVFAWPTVVTPIVVPTTALTATNATAIYAVGTSTTHAKVGGILVPGQTYTFNIISFGR